MSDVCIVGSGSWGTAISVLLAKKGVKVTLCCKSEKKYNELIQNGENISALPGVKLPDNILVTMDPETAVKAADVTVLAVASPYIRKTAREIAPFVKPGSFVVDVAKGIEEDTLMTMEAVVEQEIPHAKTAVLSGPSHAEEVGRGIPTTCVIGAKDKETAEFLQNLFMSDTFRVYINPDVLGVSLGGALKNVIALAAGIADGLGYGDNTKAALITRGISEMSRLGIKMGASPESFGGLSGIGDLIVTCASMHSRNRRAGILIGQGKSYEEAMKEVEMVVEGVYAARAAGKLALKYGVEMPIVNEVNKVLFEGKPPADAVNDLMMRDKTAEVNSMKWGE